MANRDDAANLDAHLSANDEIILNTEHNNEDEIADDSEFDSEGDSEDDSESVDESGEELDGDDDSSDSSDNAADPIEGVSNSLTTLEIARDKLFNMIVNIGSNVTAFTVGSDRALRAIILARDETEPTALKPSQVRLFSRTWNMWRILNQQLREDVIEPHVRSIAASIRDVQAREFASEPDWSSLLHVSAVLTLESAQQVWSKAMTSMILVLTLQWESRRVDEQICRRFGDISGMAKKRSLMSEECCDLVFKVMRTLSILISDVGFVLSHPQSNLQLRDLASLPSRHNMLQDLVHGAPSIEKLHEVVQEVLNQLPSDKRVCSICFIEWNAAIVSQDDSLDKSHNVRVGIFESWLAISEDEGDLVVEPGFEQTPLKMQCGHVFCAGCMQSWLKSTDGPLQCPYRDQQYGVHRSRALSEIEDIRQEYEQDCEAGATSQPANEAVAS